MPFQYRKTITELKRLSQNALIEYAQQLEQELELEESEETPMSDMWITADGEYGEGDLMVFHPESLTEEQYNLMVEMKGNHRFDYVRAILEGDLETVAQFHEEYGVE